MTSKTADKEQIRNDHVAITGWVSFEDGFDRYDAKCLVERRYENTKRGLQ